MRGRELDYNRRWSRPVPDHSPLLTTKLFLPPARASLVPRPRLTALVADGLSRPLTLISAPAGFGKTTLLAEWRAAEPGRAFPLAWLSLDSEDNDPGRFLEYLIAAMAPIRPGFGDMPLALLRSPQPPPEQAILQHLIAEWSQPAPPFALVLDDYHVIKNRAIHEAVTFLLEHRPPALHLVILTRADPFGLPLARLRVRDHLTEIRAADLRFTTQEAAAFLNQTMGLNLTPADVAALEARTEGWIAGLQLAALSMLRRTDRSDFVRAFTGSHVYIAEYLVDEVLHQQPDAVRDFLLQTSILDRLNGPLCDAVTAGAEGQDRLQRLFNANLFLVALDDEQRWFRYHHLFADLLRARLDQAYPELTRALHARAAAWLDRNGFTVEAVNHALAAGDHAQAARLVEANTSRLLARGELHALTSWIEALPAEVRRTRPWLCVHQAYVLAFAGRLAEVQPLLDQALATPEVGPASESAALRGAVAAVGAMTAVMAGRDVEALALASRARDWLPPDDLWDRATAAWATGYAQRSLGRLAESGAAFEEQIHLARTLGNVWTLVTGLTDLAQVVRTQGRLRPARQLFETALAEAGRQGARSLGYIARMEAGLAGVLLEQNELEAAGRLLAEALAHTWQWPNPNHLAYAHALQARVQLARGELQNAWVSIGAADQVRANATLTRTLRRMVETELVRVWLALRAAGGRLAAGDPLAGQAGALVNDWRQDLTSATDTLDENAELAALMLARASLADGQIEAALSLLDRVAASAPAAGRIGTEISALVLAATARQRYAASGAPADDQAATALAALEAALRLAEPGGYLRVFLDEGRPMQMLLARWLAQAGANPLRSYATHLLSQMEAEPPVRVPAPAAPAAGLIEPLSPRELEVLHLIAQGATNPEIARQLVVAPGTVKAHTASLYRKLDVANRTEAVARARRLGLLP